MRKLSGTHKPFNLSALFHHQLGRYAAAASAAGVGVLAVAHPAEAKIVFTRAHVKITPNHKYFFDLNHDGIKDFELDDNAHGSSAFVEIHALQTGNALAQAKTDCNPSVGVAALNAGVLIGKGQVFYGSLYCMAQKISEGSFGSWAFGVKNRFLGFQFVIQGKKHFGWARLSISESPYVVELNGYAYETIPNKPIIAGKTNGPDQGSIEAPNRSLAVPGSQTATLGMLAQGAPALSIWRREKSIASTR
jgi:hypothetical protein